ncbi:MAG: multiple sugar transport system permease protein, partial [Chloroflexota bacterium]|nr:multiple sugar transport system permease protein [Chloroflexota bacterium]
MAATAMNQPPAKLYIKQRKWGDSVALGLGILVLIAGAIWMLLPLVWMVSASLMPLSEVIKVPPIWFAPDKYSLSNYIEVWGRVGFAGFFLNSVFVAGTITFAQLL